MANPHDLYPLTAEKLERLRFEVTFPAPGIVWVGLSDDTGSTYYSMNLSVRQVEELFTRLTLHRRHFDYL